MAKDGEREVHAELVLRSRTGASLITDRVRPTRRTLARYKAEPDDAAALRDELSKAGFRVVASSAFGVSFAGPRELFEEVFATRVVEHGLRLRTGRRKEQRPRARFMADPPRMPLEIARRAEHLYLPRPGYLLEGEGPMPTPDYYHLRPPEDVARLVRADQAHARGYRGSGMKVGMVDTGFVASHDYYAGRGYDVTVHAVIGDPERDEIGHGTAIAANCLAIAPDCEFHFFKAMTEFDYDWAVLPAFRLAVEEGCSVISCSWGWLPDVVFEAEILSAVEDERITVVFACGNGGDVAWPSCLPEVLSVGGAFPLEEGGWEASSYASSGDSPDEPGRFTPDVCGIVGHEPEGILIVMPTESASWLDGTQAGMDFVYPYGDLTDYEDGWAVASGTSSAAPMAAAAAALMLEAHPGLPPSEIKRVLRATCTDVSTGVSASGHRARPHYDVATGAGVIDVGSAVEACAAGPGCPLGPIYDPGMCLRAPYVDARWCERAPVVQAQCLRAPLQVCLVAPVLSCARGPSATTLPVDVCAVGPSLGVQQEHPAWAPPRRVAAGGPLLPVVAFVDASELASWRALDAAYAQAKATLGLEGEYEGFPEAGASSRRPFRPGSGS